MDYKKNKPDLNINTRDLKSFDDKTGNIYESLVVLSKRSNQISLEIKEEINAKLSEFVTGSDNLEEIFENREQIEVAKYYEHLPKPTLIAIAEFANDQIFFRNPLKENKENKEEE